MQDLKVLLSDPEDSSYRKALETVEKLKASAGDFEAVKILSDIFNDSKGNSLIRNRVIKTMGGLEHPSAIEFIKSALDDDLFEVRRTAALSLKLLTDEDYYPRIYKSETGKHFRRSFWCSMDFYEEGIEEPADQTDEIVKGFASLFAGLSNNWTYPDIIRETYFTPKRKKPLEMASDAKNLYKIFNYTIEKTLRSANNIHKTLKSMEKVSSSESGEHAEIEDILRCLKLSLSTGLKDLEEGVTGFLAVFHFLRMEYNISLATGQCQPIDEPGREYALEDEKFMESIHLGMEKYVEFRGGEYVDMAAASRYITLLKERIEKFIDASRELSLQTEITPEGYMYLKQMGVYGYDLGKYCLLLLSCWTSEE
jgi:hypothetical protein